ncbi:MAG: cystathionine beta-lyase [Turicibacter sp.]|nr:cystathionine beta-lyase [Turicibacter sp.]
MSTDNYTFQTKLLHNKYKWDATTGGVSVPIQNASTFHQCDIDSFGEYDYARSDNPTRRALEEIIAELEGGTRGFAFSSGMAAISTALLLLSAGDHILVTEDVYGGTYRILTKVLNRLGIAHTFVDMTNLEQVKSAARPNTKAFYLETPSNPTLKVTDIQAVTAIAKEVGAITFVDNTFLTPALQQPLALGADVILHSATKFLGGHSDVVAGLAVVKDEALAERLYVLQNAFGAVLGPHDCWLVMRGIKTLHVRLEASSRSAAKIADYLSGHPEVKQVYYPGMGAVLSFELADVAALKICHEHLQIPAFAVSLGGVESILSYPAKMSHASMPKEERDKRGISDSLLRLSVGLENPDDLIADLAQALEQIK